MGFNFPNTPSEGAVYAAPTGRQYVYQGGVWRQAENILTPHTAVRQNLFVNGAFQISQENGNAAVGANGWPVDQMTHIFNGAFGSNAQRFFASHGRFGVGAQNSLVVAVAAATEYLIPIYSYIEGIRLAPLKWGYQQAIPAVLNFKASASRAGTYGCGLKLADGTQMIGFDVVIPAASILYEYTFQIPANPNGNWLLGSLGHGATMMFTHTAGANHRAAAHGVWQGSNANSGPNTGNNSSVVNTNLQIFDVGLYPDPNNTGVAPPFLPNSYAEDLAQCQRYYTRDNSNSPLAMGGNAPGAGTWYQDVQLPTAMRTAPAIAFTISASSGMTTQMTLSAATTLGFRYYCVNSAAGSWYTVGYYTADARLP